VGRKAAPWRKPRAPHTGTERRVAALRTCVRAPVRLRVSTLAFR